MWYGRDTTCAIICAGVSSASWYDMSISVRLIEIRNASASVAVTLAC